MQKQTDYLVIGAGASALSFVDVMLRETDATFTIVDRRHAPGGHWNDAYPFVRLHQPSAYYGVSSRPLGGGRKDVSGFNEGYYELATGTEVTNYFHALMREVFLPSGRVAYHPMSEYTADGEIVHLISGARHRVEVGKSLVDGTRLQTRIPLSITQVHGRGRRGLHHPQRLAADRAEPFAVCGARRRQDRDRQRVVLVGQRRAPEQSRGCYRAIPG